ncbi:MAG: transporter [Frankiales bacterium]|nr:transporter [Frankiales bacterium]
MRAWLDLLRRNRDFRRVYLSELVTSGGDWFALIPLLTLLKDITDGGLAGGLVLTADTAVFALLAPYAGTLADRLDRKRLIVGSEAASAGLALLLLLVHDRSTVWIAVLAVGLLAATKAIATPASSAATPNIVAPEDLALANVMNGVAWGSMLAVGAALGGVGAALFGTDACFVIDAVSFALSAVLVSRCTVPFQQARESSEHPGFGDAIHEAVTFARSDRSVLALIAVKPGVAFANGSLVLFPLLATDVFHQGAAGTGLLYAARGLGALTGPLLLGSRGRDSAAMWWMLAAFVSACGLLYVLVAAAPYFWMAVLLVAMAHLGGGANWTVSTYGLQKRVPDRVLGRVMSADFMLVTLVIALNQIVAGLLSEVVGTRLLLGCFGLASVGYAMVWLTATRSLRRTPLPTGA